MTPNFWTSLGPKLYALAPMEDVTDTVFREVVLSTAGQAKLHVMYTEFVSTDGLCHPVGRGKVSHRLFVNPSERALLREKGVKLVAQVWGSRPEKYREAVRHVTEAYDFDGIDINMGCPVKKVVKQGSCSALIGQPELAKEIIFATKESTHLPVSVKTRTGIRKHQTEEWMDHVFSAGPAAVILHCRTQADQSERPADWSQMPAAVAVRDRLAPGTPLLGNGDIFSMQDAAAFLDQTGADGVMFGRGIFHNPWLFSDRSEEPRPEEKLALLLKHATLYDATWGHTKNFSILRRFFKIYAHNFEGAHKLKVALMETHSLEEVRRLVEDFH